MSSALPKLYCKNILDGLVPPAFKQHSDLDYVSSFGSCLPYLLASRLEMIFPQALQMFFNASPKGSSFRSALV